MKRKGKQFEYIEYINLCTAFDWFFTQVKYSFVLSFFLSAISSEVYIYAQIIVVPGKTQNINFLCNIYNIPGMIHICGVI